MTAKHNTTQRKLPLAFALLFGAVAPLLAASPPLQADDQRASLRLPSREGDGTHTATSPSAALVAPIAPQPGGEIFARTREEARQKILAELLDEQAELIPPPETSISAVGLCEGAFSERELPAIQQALKPHERIVPQLAVEWVDETDAKKALAAVRSKVGDRRYEEAQQRCAEQENSAAMQPASAEQLSPAAIYARALEILESRQRELASLQPATISLRSPSGSKVQIPRIGPNEARVLAQRRAQAELQYEQKLKSLLGDEAWSRLSLHLAAGEPSAEASRIWLQASILGTPPDQARARLSDQAVPNEPSIHK